MDGDVVLVHASLHQAESERLRVQRFRPGSLPMAVTGYRYRVYFRSPYQDWAAKVGANQATHDLPEEHYVYAFPYWTY